MTPALLLAMIAATQSFDRFRIATPDDEPISGAVQAGLSFFDISDSDFRDANGIGITAQLGVHGKPPDLGVVELGYSTHAGEMKATDNRFRLDIASLGGGLVWGPADGRISLGLTGGYLYYFSNDIRPKDEFNDGVYGAAMASARLHDQVGIFVRLAAHYVGHAGRIDGEGMDWITATTVGVDLRF